MKFGEALELAKSGRAIQRSGWNGKGMHVKAQFPDAHSKMGEPYLYLRTVGGTLIPWTVYQADLFAEDWQAIQE